VEEDSKVKRKRTAAISGVVLAALFLIAADAIIDSRPVLANACDACKASYNQCRIKRKGHPSCDRAYEACLKNCLRSGRQR
jgi:hypothetical protein